MKAMVLTALLTLCACTEPRLYGDFSHAYGLYRPAHVSGSD